MGCLTYLLCYLFGALSGLGLAGGLGAWHDAVYRQRLRRQIEAEALERDWKN